MSTELSSSESQAAIHVPAQQASGHAETVSPVRSNWGETAWGILRVVRVRFRFFGVLLVTALVAGQWERITKLANRAWDSLAQRSGAADVVSADTEFFCPMCPGVLSAWPDKCPVCFMPLVRRKKGEAMLLPDGVIARMQVSPQRIQLAGVRTEPVEYRTLEHEFTSVGLVALESDNSESVNSESDSAGNSNVDEPRLPNSRRLRVLVALTPSEVPLLEVGQTASIRRDDSSDTRWSATVAAVLGDDPSGPRAVLEPLSDTSELVVGSVVRVTWHRSLSEHEPFREQASEGKLLSVPESAVVDTGEERLVFVETAPGMFDGVWVELGPRAGGYYPVLQGLQEGQRVAAAGAFLLDAETRLSPHLRAAYFGSGAVADGGEREKSSEQPKRTARKKPRTVKELLAEFEMTPEDRAAAEKQQVCPVTKMKLGSMGAPVRVLVDGRAVYLCCEGCRSQVENEGKPSPP